MNATMLSEEIKHHPVMLNQILSIISPQHGGTFIDCTFGGGGYSKAILKYSNTNVFAIDRDATIEPYAKNLIKKYPKRFSFYLDKFSNLKKIIKLGIKANAIIFDLGVSSYQLLDNKRGFSFKSKEKLSMQMGINKYSAYEVVNNFDKMNLTKIIKILGEEKDGKLIANRIVQYREKKTIETAEELSTIINKAKKNYNNYKKNPATKTFQAIRIFVNHELTELILGLIAATEILVNGGILVVVSFHSLEDKIVKNFFNFYSNLNKNPSRYLPKAENISGFFKTQSKKPLMPTAKEIEKNYSSRSAKLRYAVRNNNNFFYPTEIYQKFENYFKLQELTI